MVKGRLTDTLGLEVLGWTWTTSGASPRLVHWSSRAREGWDHLSTEAEEGGMVTWSTGTFVDQWLSRTGGGVVRTACLLFASVNKLFYFSLSLYGILPVRTPLLPLPLVEIPGTL